MFEGLGSGFSSLLETLRTPEGKRALLTAGLHMMQPVPYGQSPLGNIAAGIGAGVDAYDAQVAQGKKDLQQQEEDARATRELDIKQQEANDKGSGVSFTTLFTNEQSNKRAHSAAIRRMAEQEASARNNSLEGMKSPVTPDQLLADPANVDRYEKAYKASQGGGNEPAPTPPAPEQPAAPEAKTSEAAPTADRTFASFKTRFPDKWNAILLARYHPDAKIKAAAEAAIQQLKSSVVDPQAVDAELAKQQG